MHDHGILLLFIDFQHRLKLQQLDIERDTYRRQEKKVTKAIKILGCILLVPLVVLLTTEYFIGIHATNILWIDYSLFVYILSISLLVSVYSRIVISLLTSMYSYHRMEFQQHAKTMVLNYLATLLSFGFLIGWAVLSSYFLLCIQDALHYFPDSVTTAYYDPKNPNGFCHRLFSLELASGSYKNLTSAILTFDIAFLSPIILFLLVNEPHDCFVCHGKDPDRIYSSYQLTWEERTARKMVARYGGTKKQAGKALQKQSS